MADRLAKLEGMGPVRTLVAELKLLRQGRPIGDGALATRLSPGLRAAFGVFEHDSADIVRAKVFRCLTDATAGLAAEERRAVRAAFGLAPEFSGRFYKDRAGAFAAAADVNPRTVRRWVDRALEHVATALLTPVADNGNGPAWWTDELRLSLALDRPGIESLEQRRVIAAHGGLTELDLAMTITDADPATVLERVSFRVFYGGTLRVGPMESSDRVGLALILPKPLAQGESHEFALLTRLPDEHDMRRHYVCVPRYRCTLLHMRVRFGADTRPDTVGKLVDVYQRDVDDAAVHAEDVAVDAAGEVHVTFTDLAPDRATGLRW